MLNSGRSYTLVEDPNAGVLGMSVKVLKPDRKSLSGKRSSKRGAAKTHPLM